MPSCLFPSRSYLVEEMLLAMVKKTMDHHVLSNLASAILVSVSFDFEKSHIDVDTFVLIINFLNDNWVPMHVNVGLFEVNRQLSNLWLYNCNCCLTNLVYYTKLLHL